MLDLKYVLGQRRGGQAELPRTATSGRRARRRRSRSSRCEGRAQERCSRRSRTVRRRQNEVAQATGKEKDPAKRAELVAEGKRLKAEVGRAARSGSRRLDAELKRRLGRDPQPDPPRRPRRPDRGREPRAPQGRHAPHVRLQAEGPRRDRQGARPDRLRGRRQGRRARVLLPQERRGAAGPGPPAVRDAEAGRGAGSRRSSRPTWPGIRSWKGSASRPAGAETQVYSVEDTDLCLIGTAEITLGGMHADEILDEAEPAAEVRRPLALLPHRGRRGRPGEPGALPRPPVHQGRDVRLHARPRPRARCTRRCWRIEEEIFTGAGHPVPRARHLLGRPGRAGLPQVRPRGLDARPRRGRRVRRGDQHVRLHRLPGPPAQHPLQAGRPEGDAVRPHAQRHGRRAEPGPDRRSWRTTSGPTAGSTSPRCCGPIVGKDVIGPGVSRPIADDRATSGGVARGADEIRCWCPTSAS